MARLRDLVVLDSAPEPLFDAIARLASEVCGVPIALLSLVDAQRQWFKANIGLPGVSETPRDIAFCAHAIGDDAIFEVPDTTGDPRFAANPLVTADPSIRFYAGAPLTMPGGERIGTLCVIDREARRLNVAQASVLRSLAAVATQALIMRRDLITKALSVRSEFEQALGVSEARYRAIVEEQTELVSLARPDGTLAYVNPAYSRHFGMSPQQMTGTNLFDFIEPADRDAVRLQVSTVLASGEDRSGENRMVAATGEERWVAWTNRRQYDAHNQPLLHSVGRDITQRRRAELALRESQSFLKRTGQVAGVGGWQLELGSAALTWSDETRSIHEVDSDYVPTLDSALQFYAPAARLIVEEAVQMSIASGKPWDLELPIVTAKGREIWVRAVGEVDFEEGKAVRLIGALQDITVRKCLEQRVADSEQFIRQVTDNLPLRIAYVDHEQRYRFVNLPLCQRFGLPREDIIGRTRSELESGSAAPAESKHAAAALVGQVQRFEYEELLSGVSYRIESHLLPDVAADGTVRGFFSTGVDITERSAAERALRELTAILEKTPDFVMQADWRGQITYINPALRRVTGIAPDDPVTHRNFTEFHPTDTQQRFVDVIVPAVKSQGAWLGETTLYAAGRFELPVSYMVIGHPDATGRIASYSAVMRDISIEIKSKQEVQRQADILRSVTEAIPTTVVVVGTDGRYRFANGAFERYTGQPREKILGRTAAEVLGEAEIERRRPWMKRAFAGETVNFTLDYPSHDGTTYLSLTCVPLRGASGVVEGFVGISQDITQQRREQDRLTRLSQRDALTGLFNRAGFEEQVERCVQDGEGASLGLLYIDLDHFKPVNDRHGHQTGDRLLQLFAQRLSALVRPTDTVARLGGDEFAILLIGVRGSANAQMVAKKVIHAARTPFEVDTVTVSIGASVGVAFGVDPVAGWRDLVARADAMLFRAKEGGRGRQAGERE